MRSPFRILSLAWIPVLALAIGFLIQLNRVRTERVVHLASLAETAPAAVDPASPTGYVGGVRELIVPEHNNDSYQWIAQTQQMLARGEWRLRHVDYDNAPNGRDIRTPSPYRWWLGAVSWFESKRSGQPSAPATERAALSADPALQIILLIITAIFTAWRFGALPASLLCLGFAGLFPFASAFLPGQPGDYGLILVCALWSMLPLLAGSAASAPGATSAGATSSARNWFFLAGLAGGFGLWLSVTRELPVLVGLALGGLIAPLVTRRDVTAQPQPWRAWALGGAVACLAAWLIEYFPARLELRSWRIETVHPLYAVAWLGGGELLVCLTAWLQRGKSAWTRRTVIIAALSVLAVASVPAAILLKGDRSWLSADAFAARLTNLPNGAVADNLPAWLARDHFDGAIAATLTPLLLLIPVVWLLARRATHSSQRAALAFAFGPLLVALGFACFQLHWWNLVDSALLGLVVAAAVAAPAGLGRWIISGATVLVLVPGLFQLRPSANFASADTVTEPEVEALIERDLAHWLANRVGPDGAIVLAPPSLTTSLYFHGGLRGLGTPYTDNKDGFAAAVRIAAASSADEAQALIRKRTVTHIIMPSWDTFLDDYARLGSNQPEHTLVGLLHQWLPPRWLRPIPYHLPQILGFENQSVVVFEVVEVQDNISALSHLAEYFVEMGQVDQASAVGRALVQAFPNDLSSIIAQTQIAIGRRDGRAFNELVNTLVPRLPEDEAQALPWDRRVSLAIVLSEAKRFEPAREQVTRLLAEVDEPALRALDTTQLYRLLALGKVFKIEISDPHLHDLALSLLPSELRSAL